MEEKKNQPKIRVPPILSQLCACDKDRCLFILFFIFVATMKRNVTERCQM